MKELHFRLIPHDITPCLTPEQRAALEVFFDDAPPEQRQKAIFRIDRGLQWYRAEKENPRDPIATASQIQRIQTSVEHLLDELRHLSPDTQEALLIAGQETELSLDVQSRAFQDSLKTLGALCRFASKKFSPNGKKQRPKGSTEDASRVLALEILEAYYVAFGRHVKRQANDRYAIDPIYKILGLPVNRGILRQLTDNTMDFK